MKLYELHKQGGTFFETEHTYLYHMTDHHGFAYTVDQNALRGLRQGYVSTTYDPNKSGVYGYSHYDFKFVMNGKALVKEYGGFNYDHYIQVGNSRKLESLDEREIGIETRSIEPFKDYLLGSVLLCDLFSQTAIQWLLYDNTAYKGFMGPDKAAAPRAIAALYTHCIEWHKPLWMSTERKGMRKPTQQEIRFLKDAFTIHERGGDFDEGMRELVAKYPVKDHWQKDLDRMMVVRRQSAKKLYTMLNKYYQDRPYNDVDVNVVRKMIERAIDILALGNNIKNVVLGAIDSHGLFHKVMAPVDWGTILKPLMDGDVDEALEAIEWMAENKERYIQMHDNDPKGSPYSRHAGTMF